MKLGKAGFEHRISLGQNFLPDPLLQRHLVSQAPLGSADTVLEIGAGMGDMTLALAEACRQVVTLEIDPRLEPRLLERFEDRANIRLVMGDVMEVDLAAMMREHATFHVAANLPYYLTTPILNLLFRSQLPIRSVSVMVQQEAAQRVLATPGTPEYGPLALLTMYRSEPRAAVNVPAGAFSPPPKVDSVFLVMPFLEVPRVSVDDESLLFRLFTSAFAMRRKTLENNLMSAFHFTREAARRCLACANLPVNIRGEKLSLEDFARLAAPVQAEIEGAKSA